MTLQELQNQVLQLSIRDRWQLVQSVLTSIQQETLSSAVAKSSANLTSALDPWTQSLIGVIQLNAEDSAKSYEDYLEEKYS
ncbi:MAG: hypothetical protein HC895_24245 [Leptolyngbyaceae cyanobacterium SM1_3_5]|nr:hypothetical protein [Leptolyngbyaceae cyanobacterium SM1_3_5]